MSEKQGSSTSRRNFLRLSSALALLPAAALAGEQDFKLINKTGFTIDSVFITPHDAKDWGDDILGQDSLPNNTFVNIHFSRKEKAALWDLSVVDDDDEEYIWERINLLKISEVTLFYSKKNGATAEFN